MRIISINSDNSCEISRITNENALRKKNEHENPEAARFHSTHILPARGTGLIETIRNLSDTGSPSNATWVACNKLNS